ncbi:MAG: LuxR C-terminal-related transcriptional regulator [Proteobacteria bacterium]|nr:LuxR C-terminal-related transcriptional regulator [Pseudomonadota bacterium]
MDPQIIKTKLNIPPSRADLVHRPRLLKKMDIGKSVKLTVITAPAGSGKTTILSDWVRKIKLPVAWISLDDSDNDPASFCAYILAAIQTTPLNIGHPVSLMLQTPPSPPMKAILTALLNEFENNTQELVFVLDDYHEITNEKIHDGLSFLLQHLPPQIHLIIASRASLPINLGRWRLQGQLHELNGDDLRFNAAEATLFFNETMKLRVNNNEINIIEKRSEGWIAGLQMAALSLKRCQNTSECIANFSGDNAHFSDFFVEEVLQHQPDPIRHFLYKTAILDRLCGPLCAAVTGLKDSTEILNQIYDANLFLIALDEKKEWYRYHRLFSELLLSQLEKSETAPLSALHLNASRWFEAHHNADEAIQHALKAGANDMAIDLVGKFGEDYLFRSKRATVCRWIETLPEAVIKKHALLCVTHAWAIYPEKSKDTFHKVEERLAQAEELLQQTTRDATRSKYFTNRHGISSIAALKAILAREKAEDPQKIISLSKQALENLGEEDSALRSIMLLNLGLMYFITGNYDSGNTLLLECESSQKGSTNFHTIACSAYFRAWLVAGRGHLLHALDICETARKAIIKRADIGAPIVGCLNIFMAHIWVEQNQIDRATDVLTKSIESMRLTKEWGFFIKGYATLIRIKLARKESICGILQLIDEIALMDKYRSGAKFLAVALKLKVLTENKDVIPEALNKAEVCVLESNLELETTPIYGGHFQYEEWYFASQMAMVRLIIKQHRFGLKSRMKKGIADVLVYLESRMVIEKQKRLDGRLIEIYILQAMAHDALKDQNAALKAVKKAILMSAPEGFVRLYIEEGDAMEHLLVKVTAQGHHVPDIQRLMDAFRMNKQIMRAHVTNKINVESLVESLSERELEVLRLIAAGLSNREIAIKLFISEGTIKKHNYNIYGKLQVTKRTQAVNKAKFHGILED